LTEIIRARHSSTITDGPTPTAADLLIGEARERQRKRRWLIAAIVFIGVVAGLALARAGQPGGTGGSGTPSLSGGAGARGAVAGGPPQNQVVNLNPRQAIDVTSVVKTVHGHKTIGLGFENVSPTPATLLISLKGRVPLRRTEVAYLAPGLTFRNGTIVDPLQADHFKQFLDLQLAFAKGSAGEVEVDLQRDFGAQGAPSTQIYGLWFGP
jgi:hypothetical protein